MYCGAGDGRPSGLRASDLGAPESAARLSPVLRLFLVPLLLSVAGCGARSGDRGGQIQMRNADREIELDAVFQRPNAERGTWHLLVHRDGSMSSLAYFTTDVTPLTFYEKLRALGFEANDTVSCEAMDDPGAATAGEELEYLFSWEGGPERMPLDELLVEVLPEGADAGTKGLEMRFGGNHTGADAKSPPSHESGCLACLYTCCAGVTSNSRANLALLRRENEWHRYRLNPEVDLPDGTRVKITIRRAE